MARNAAAGTAAAPGTGTTTAKKTRAQPSAWSIEKDGKKRMVTGMGLTKRNVRDFAIGEVKVTKLNAADAVKLSTEGIEMEQISIGKKK